MTGRKRGARAAGGRPRAFTVTDVTVKPGRLRVVAYCRVSTEEQSEEGVSLAAQREKMQKWAAANDHELVAVHEDAGFSGAKGSDKRPGLSAALLDLKEGRASALVVVKLDRLTRSVRFLVGLVEDVFSDRFALVSLSENVDTGTAMGRAFLQFVGIIAELERGMIRERTRDALRHIRGLGVRLGGEAIGWKRTAAKDGDGRRVVRQVPVEAATVERIRALRRRGHSLPDICTRLAAEGHATKRGGRWHPKVVRSVLLRHPVARRAA